MKQIKLTQGKYAIVDDEDYPYLNRFKWYIEANGHVVRQLNSKFHNDKLVTIPMRSLLLNYKQGYFIIHKNSNKLDLRKTNLQYVSFQAVQHKRAKMNCQTGRKLTSKYKWVSFDKAAKNKKYAWKASLTVNSKKLCNHRFSTERDAAIFANAKAREAYGELAYQNKI